MNAPSNIAFRLATLLFAILLGMQCIWLLLVETSRPGIDRLPTDATAAAAAARERDAAAWTALIGGIRGELWAESAFTYTDLLFGKTVASANTDIARSLARTRASLVHALGEAPHQSGAWLLLAALALHDPSAGFSATEALKMSYYTGPSDQDLMPLRLRMAVNADTFNDVEMRQFIARDLRVFLARKQKSTITAAYSAASPAGKRLIEQTVKDVDPSALSSLATGKTGQFLPD